METLDPLSIATEGTRAYSVAIQASQLAKKARELGLNDQADAMMKALYSSIKSKNEKGFTAAIAAEGAEAGQGGQGESGSLCAVSAGPLSFAAVYAGKPGEGGGLL